MQFASASAFEGVPEAVGLLGFCEDPQAASATAEPTAARPVSALRFPSIPIFVEVVHAAE